MSNPIFVLLLTRLQSSKTDKFCGGLIRFICFCVGIQKEGVTVDGVIGMLDRCQPQPGYVPLPPSPPLRELRECQIVRASVTRSIARCAESANERSKNFGGRIGKDFNSLRVDVDFTFPFCLVRLFSLPLLSVIAGAEKGDELGKGEEDEEEGLTNSPGHPSCNPFSNSSFSLSH